MMLTSWSVIELTGALRRVNTSLAAWNTFHVCHADFFPSPTKADTVSQPVNVWKKRRALHLGSSDRGIWWTGIHPKDLPFSEGNPQLIDMKINENRYSQDNSICVWTTDGYAFVACNCCMFGVKMHTCASFCIDVTVVDNNVIFSFDNYRISICCDDQPKIQTIQFCFDCT